MGLTEFKLRPAASEDFPSIKRLIDLVEINPMGLDWHRFILAVDSSDRMLGCGQLKPHRGGIVELASIAVEPDYRHLGIASAIINKLIEAAPRPLYLTCLSSMASFYGKWGFCKLKLEEMPVYFRQLVHFISIMPGWDSSSDPFTVMKLM
jgi:N-acetylglutamate synthase-like GNAT family acetyltransferase